MRVMRRCEEEEERAAAIERNAGKELNYFKLPSLLKRERFAVKKNTL